MPSHPGNPSVWEVKGGGSRPASAMQWVWDQPQLHETLSQKNQISWRVEKKPCSRVPVTLNPSAARQSNGHLQVSLSAVILALVSETHVPQAPQEELEEGSRQCWPLQGTWVRHTWGLERNQPCSKCWVKMNLSCLANALFQGGDFICTPFS